MMNSYWLSFKVIVHVQRAMLNVASSLFFLIITIIYILIIECKETHISPNYQVRRSFSDLLHKG
jgi:hypothetical protein